LLAEARAAAERLSEAGTSRLYDHRMMAWVYLDSIKQEAQRLPEALPHLQRLLDLPLDATDTVLWEQLYWQLAKVLFRAQVTLSPTNLDAWKSCWNNLPKVSGKAYSVLLKALLSQSWPNLPDWLDAWGWENLQPEDLVAETAPNGKAFPALAERAYIAAAKSFLDISPDTGRFSAFVSQLDAFSEANPQMMYLLYYRVQLRLKSGQLDDALRLLLPFARQKQREFWVWDLMADLQAGQPRRQLACYAKALTCQAKPEFLVKLRQKYARLLVQQGRWAEAKTEIEEVIRVRTAHQWRIPAEISDWANARGYHQVAAGPINASAYVPRAELAGQLLYDPQAGVVGVVSGINAQKRTAQFVVSESVTGGFGYGAMDFVPAVGDCVLLHIEQRTAPDGTPFQKVLHAQPATAVDSPMLQTFTGTFKRVGTVGFVKNVFVEEVLAATLQEHQTYEVGAVRSFNPKRQAWGWKAYRVSGLS
jgi:hypothetical protein